MTTMEDKILEVSRTFAGDTAQNHILSMVKVDTGYDVLALVDITEETILEALPIVDDAGIFERRS